MLDHGQLGPPTPAAQTPASSRRPSIAQIQMTTRSRLGSMNDTRPRRPSGLADSLSMSSLTMEEGNEDTPRSPTSSTQQPLRYSPSNDGIRRPSGPLRPFTNLPRGVLESLSMSALDDTEDESEEGAGDKSPQSSGAEQIPSSRQASLSMEAAAWLGRRLSDAVLAMTPDTLSPTDEEPANLDSAEHADQLPEESTTHFGSSGDLVAQLYANPKLAALRSPMGMKPILASTSKPQIQMSPPILANPKCSGYFLEPVGIRVHALEARSDDALIHR